MDAELRQALEAILFVADEPVEVTTLSQVLEVGRADVEHELERLEGQLREEDRGFVLRQVAGGWRLYTASGAAPYLERWVLSGRSSKLSQAALETLAVVAYKQPITRQEIGEIRGVNVDGVVKTLEARELIEEIGRDEGPGQAILYGTTRRFLEKLGLDDVSELPPLTEFLAEGPAPDEPSPGDLRLARERLQAGQDLPSTGRSRWDPDVDEEDDEELLERRTARRGRREQEMDELSDALERAAQNAMDVLEDALRSVEGDEPGDDAATEGGDDPEGEDAGSGSP